MKGGDGFFRRSPRSTVLTTNVACSSSATMACVSAPVDGTIFSPAFSRSAATNSGGRAAARYAWRLQYSWGTKARMSRSRSQINRTATDWTRPADRPRRTRSQRRGLIL